MIRVGAVGCGYWGINYVRVFGELPNCTVTRVCDVRGERLDYVKQRYPLINTHTTVNDLLGDDRLDAVVVSVPASGHYEVVRDSLLAGKHVLCEKPLTTTVDQADDLINLAREQNRVLMVGHTFLYNNAVRKLKEIVRQDEFGRVYYLHATRTNLGPIRQDVNAVWDLAAHDVAIFNYLLDSQPWQVSAVGSKLLGNSHDDVSFITLTYPNGVIANIHVSWADPNKVREVVVVGSNKRVVFDDLNSLEPLRIFEKGVAPDKKEADTFGEYRLLVRDGDILSPRIEPNEPLKTLAQHFLACVSEGAKPLTSGEDGRDVVRVLRAIDSSLRAYGRPVEIPAAAGVSHRTEVADSVVERRQIEVAA
jgi:predicted dehydrogenase